MSADRCGRTLEYVTDTHFSSSAGTSSSPGISSSPGTTVADRTVFRPVLILLAGFLVVSAVMEVVLIALSATGGPIDSTVWTRCSLVLGSSIILLLFAFRAARGSRSYWLRVRIISPIVVTAVVVVVSIPGFLPDWVRVEQGVCGVLVLAAAILVNLPRARAHFPGTHFPGTHFPGTE